MVVGALPISEARAKGLIHRIARVMVLDPTRTEILLQKRASDSWTFPNAWDNSAAGHVDEGEDYLAAAKREMFEEIGYKAIKLKQLGKYYTENQQNSAQLVKRFNMVYETVAPTDTVFRPDHEEVSEVRWFTREEVMRLIHDSSDEVTDGLIDVMKRFYSKD